MLLHGRPDATALAHLEGQGTSACRHLPVSCPPTFAGAQTVSAVERILDAENARIYHKLGIHWKLQRTIQGDAATYVRAGCLLLLPFFSLLLTSDAGSQYISMLTSTLTALPPSSTVSCTPTRTTTSLNGGRFVAATLDCSPFRSPL